MIRRLFTALIHRDTRHRKGLPPITPARAALREQIRAAEALCRCKEVGRLRAQMRDTLHDELKGAVKGGRNDLSRWSQFGGSIDRPDPPTPTRPKP